MLNVSMKNIRYKFLGLSSFINTCKSSLILNKHIKMTYVIVFFQLLAVFLYAWKMFKREITSVMYHPDNYCDP